jgi:hypothetical protein
MAPKTATFRKWLIIHSSDTSAERDAAHVLAAMVCQCPSTRAEAMLERCSLGVAPDDIESTFKHDEVAHPTTNPANVSGVITQEGHCNSY